MEVDVYPFDFSIRNSCFYTSNEINHVFWHSKFNERQVIDVNAIFFKHQNVQLDQDIPLLLSSIIPFILSKIFNIFREIFFIQMNGDNVQNKHLHTFSNTFSSVILPARNSIQTLKCYKSFVLFGYYLTSKSHSYLMTAGVMSSQL